MQNKNAISKLEGKFNVKQKGVEAVQKEVCQKLVPAGAKLERYGNRTEENRQNRLFESNQKRLFKESERTQRESEIPDADESRLFWNDI